MAVFRQEDGREVAVVLIHPDKVTSGPVEPRVAGKHVYRLGRTYVTDRGRRCERSEWTGSLSPESVTTLLYVVDDPQVGR